MEKLSDLAGRKEGSEGWLEESPGGAGREGGWSVKAGVGLT